MMILKKDENGQICQQVLKESQLQGIMDELEASLAGTTTEGISEAGGQSFGSPEQPLFSSTVS